MTDILAAHPRGQGRGGRRGASARGRWRAASRRRARAQAPPPRDFDGALRAKIAAGPAGGDRRDQEGQPEQGRAARRLRPAGDRRELRARRRRVPVGAHRPRSSSRARPSTCARRAPPARCRCCARTSSSTPTRSYEARALGADCILLIVAALDDARMRELEALRARRSAWRCWSRCTTRAELERALRAADAADRHQQPQPAHLRGLAARRRSTCCRAFPPDRLVVTESGILAPRGRRADARARRATPSWSARRSCARRIRARRSRRCSADGIGGCDEAHHLERAMVPRRRRAVDPARIVAEARRLADFDVLCLQEIADNFPDPRLRGQPRARTSSRCSPRCCPATRRCRASRSTSPARRRRPPPLRQHDPVAAAGAAGVPPPAALAGRSRRARHAAHRRRGGGRGAVRRRARRSPRTSSTTRCKQRSGAGRGAARDLRRRPRARARAAIVDETTAARSTRCLRPAATVISGDFNLEHDDPLHARMAGAVRRRHAAARRRLGRRAPGRAVPGDVQDLREVGARRSGAALRLHLPQRRTCVRALRAVRVDRETQASDHQPVMLELA